MTQISVNYAKVLYELAISNQIIQETARQFETVRELEAVLKSPVTPAKEKHRVIDRIAPEEMASFLKVVCDNQDMGRIHEIFAAFHAFDCEQRGILEAELVCVTRPDGKQLDGIKSYLLKKYGKREVVLKLQMDPGLLGGFVLRVGNIESDWSFRGRLGQLQRKLMWR